ncbi:hypothetical protein AAE026_36825 [Bradyrhizobium sp. DN5]|uniref:hypothetical protein n=1 Tax=Bradyrhizobium sp. DN5 TaxID=3056950 RepID=UPI0035263DCC
MKYEKVYLLAYGRRLASACVSGYLAFYNGGHLHSSLDGRTPYDAYFAAQAMSDGRMIVAAILLQLCSGHALPTMLR